ncbi:MAG: pyruvate kinase [Bacteroidetes bacterium]|nr:pyruvate kinase [Bacteroidota bacterium]
MHSPAFNKTKIVATIGPATSDKEMLRRLIHAGVDVCRLNFSHGTHEIHLQTLKNIREINEENSKAVGILMDLQGPKLRIGQVEGEIILEDGKDILVTTTSVVSTTDQLSVSYENLARDAKINERILLNDGKVELRILEILNSTTLRAHIVAGGPLSSNKGFNLPDTRLTVPSLTEKDIHDLEFAIKHHVEWIALSFVRQPEDIIDLKKRIAASGKEIRVIAKIEKPEAVKHIDDIIRVSDAIMVARGDLGVEVPLQKVPLIQKSVVEKCIGSAKPVIIATQMMESMITDSMPTRAEINDVANAVLDGADAVMLSAETSIGKYPVKVVETMSKIIHDVEEDRRVYYKGKKPHHSSPSFASDEICFTAVRISDHLKARAIVAMTKSGFTGFRVASYRPESSIFIFTDNKTLLFALSLVWGVRGYFYNKFETTDKTFEDVLEVLKQDGIVRERDYVIHCASMPIHKKQRTNTIKVSVVE